MIGPVVVAVGFTSGALAVLPRLKSHGRQKQKRGEKAAVTVCLTLPDFVGFVWTKESFAGETQDLRKAFVFDPYREPEVGESVLARYGPFLRIETFYGQRCLGRPVEAGELDREADEEDAEQ